MMGISRFINLFFFEFILHFVLNVKLNYCIKIEDHNPWLFLMNNYRFHKYHGAGVYSDLGENVTDANNKNYKYAAGRCPVFSKVIKINGKSNFLNKLRRDKVETTKFLLEIQSGKISFTNDSSEGIQFPTVEVEEKYKLWKSPVKKETLYGCSKYASHFEHFIEEKSSYHNCISRKEGGCIKQSFIYDLKNKMCHILYPAFQEMQLYNDGSYLYRPRFNSSLNYFVFGSYNIKDNWKHFCASRSVKSVEFGKWDQNTGTCVSLNGASFKLDSYNVSLVVCEQILFIYSPNDAFSQSYGNGYNWGNYNNATRKCVIFPREPDCFIFSKDSYALVATAIKNAAVYSFPPCGIPSEGWQIKAACKDNIEKTYTCHNNFWHSPDQIPTDDCYSYVSWENIDTMQNPWQEFLESYYTENTLGRKLIKGVGFGQWHDGCFPMFGTDIIKTENIKLNDCIQLLKRRKINGKTLYGDYSENRQICQIYKQKPNCLIYRSDNFAFSEGNINEMNEYILPPCIEESEAWVINAECNNDNIMRDYVCFNGKWISFDNDIPVAECENVKIEKITRNEIEKNTQNEIEKNTQNEIEKNMQNEIEKNSRQNLVGEEKQIHKQSKFDLLNNIKKNQQKNLTNTTSASKTVFAGGILQSVTFFFVLMNL